MNYLKIYENLIEDALTNPKSDSYKEKHHIKPLCIGGNNKKSNIVYLTAKQHYLAHWLLFKIYKTSSLVYAWYCMSRVGEGQEERKINSHLFEYCKKERSKHLSKNMLGSNNPFYGKSHSDKTKQMLSNIHKGKVYKTKEQISKWVETVAKKPKSKEHREKISRKGFVVVQNINTLEIKRVEKVIYDKDYDKEAWVNPKKITPELKYKCEYCGVITNKGNLKRWHNDKCKKRKL